VFLDTNILVYALGPHDVEKSTIANLLLLEGIATRQGTISYQVVQEFLNLALGKFNMPITADTAAGYVHDVVGGLQVIAWSLDLMESGLTIAARYRFSWYDSLIVAAALASGCETLYTEDLQHGQRIEGLTVVNPFL
jgi:predicted nucleic acid-binding protein